MLLFDCVKKNWMENGTSTRVVYCLNSGLTTLSRNLWFTQDIEKVAHISKKIKIYLGKLILEYCRKYSNSIAILTWKKYCNQYCNTFYARQQNASRVFAIVWASVCLFVCLSVGLSGTLVRCIKTVQARITKSSLWAAPRSIVYRDKISCHWVQGFPSNEGAEEGYPLKRRHFAVIGLNNVKTVADRYIHAAYHNKHWWQAFGIHEHRWPWTTLNLSKRGF